MNQPEDGACGEFFLDRILRCTHEFGHAGPHSWQSRVMFVFGGITMEEVRERAKKGNPAALAILAIEDKDEGT